MIHSAEIKEIVLGYGADLCGIASVDRFVEAPEGFKPSDVYSECKSVLVFAKKLPKSIFLTNSTIPYSFADDYASNEVLRLTCELALQLEKLHISALPIPSTPYEYWDSDTMTGKGLISFKHAGHLAGLGVIGRNSLLTNPEFGNAIKLGVLLLNIELESDSIIDYSFCSDNCNLCIDNCPSNALGGVSVLQKNCRQYSEGMTKKGAPITICYNCRKICPNKTGWKIN